MGEQKLNGGLKKKKKIKSWSFMYIKKKRVKNKKKKINRIVDSMYSMYYSALLQHSWLGKILSG